MDSAEIRLECLKLGVQVATAESVERSMRAPDTERVAELTERFYALVSSEPRPGSEPKETKDSQPGQGSKKPKSDKDGIFG